MSASVYSQTKRAAEKSIDFHTQAYGHAYVGVCISAVLAAIGDYLAREHGPEKAFEYFTRAADQAIAPRLQPPSVAN